MDPIFRITSHKYLKSEKPGEEKILHATISISYVNEDAYIIFKNYFKNNNEIEFWVSDKYQDPTGGTDFIFGSISVVDEKNFSLLKETIEEVFGIPEKSINSEIADEKNKKFYTVYKSKREAIWKLKYKDDTGCYQHLSLTSDQKNLVILEAEEIARSKKVPWKLYLSEATLISEG